MRAAESDFDYITSLLGDSTGLIAGEHRGAAGHRAGDARQGHVVSDILDIPTEGDHFRDIVAAAGRIYLTFVLRSGVKVTGTPSRDGVREPTLCLEDGAEWAEVAWSEIAAVTRWDGMLS